MWNGFISSVSHTVYATTKKYFVFDKVCRFLPNTVSYFVNFAFNAERPFFIIILIQIHGQ